MKKILLTLVTIIMTVVMLAPVQAANAGTCGSTLTRTATWNYDGQADFRLKAVLAYRHCGGYDKFQYVRYSVQQTNSVTIGGSCSEGIVDEFRLNWGAYGTWNPPMRTIDCPLGSDKYTQKTVYPPNNTIIGHKNDDRCAHAYFKVVRIGGIDHKRTSSLKCLS